MERKNYSRIFYLETFILLFSFIAVILILSTVFASSKRKSMEARRLTDAVCIRENVAEISISSADIPSLQSNLLSASEEVWNEEWIELDAGSKTELSFPMDRKTLLVDSEGGYTVSLKWENDEGLITADITVTLSDGTEDIYSLSAARFLGEGGGE